MRLLDRLGAVFGDSAAEEFIYAQIVEEVTGGRLSAGLWAKALADSDGDQTKARARYMTLRAGAIRARLPSLPSCLRQLHKLKEERLTAETERAAVEGQLGPLATRIAGLQSELNGLHQAQETFAPFERAQFASMAQWGLASAGVGIMSGAITTLAVRSGGGTFLALGCLMAAVVGPIGALVGYRLFLGAEGNRETRRRMREVTSRMDRVASDLTAARVNAVPLQDRKESLARRITQLEAGISRVGERIASAFESSATP